ncbi:MAG: hypothetical protein ACRYG7_13040 [Janthinobacterium lividum]
MSPAAYSEPTPALTAQRGGLAPAPSPTPKMHPSEIALTLSADVLRLPYTPATRLVLAEIVSLYAATGCCDASNPHFMARLTLKHDVVNEAIQRLHEDGLIVKVVNKAVGFYRTLTPVPAAIAAKAGTNPYPEKATSYSVKPTSPPSRESRLAQSENPTTPSREKPLTLVGNPDTNTPYNIPVNFHQSSIASATASAAPEEKKIEEDSSAPLPAEEEKIVPPVAKPPRKKASTAEEPAAFADFLLAYPRHDDRAAAVKAFARLAEADQLAAADRAQRWLARRTDWIAADGTDYRPYPATWLNKARWKELAEPLPTPSPAAPTNHANASATLKPGTARHHVPVVTSYGKL